MKNTYLLRHAQPIAKLIDPRLSEEGRRQAYQLAGRLQDKISDSAVVVWSSPAQRAKETAEIVARELGAKLVSREKLWSDRDHEFDLEWLESEVKKFSGENLVIISHMEYVQWFPRFVGFKSNGSGYAEGVCMTDTSCVSV